MKTLIPIFILFLISCSKNEQVNTEMDNSSTNAKLETELPQVNDQFQSFLDKFPKIELPVQIKACEIKYDGLVELNVDSQSPFIKDISYVVGQINTNGNYISVITLGVTDCLLPVVTTYKLTGEEIDRKTISIGYCGPDPCYDCEEFMTLKEDFTIYTSDTIITTECDDAFESIPGTERVKVIYKEGRLTENGVIELSDEIKKEIK